MRDAIIEKLKTLAKAYVPEWSFNEKNPDAGSVIALLFADLLKDSLGRYDRALHKHKIQYLNMFDRFKIEPVECAKSFVRFTPVEGLPEPFHVPKGTRLLASGEGDETIVFETVHGLTVTNAAPAAVFTADGTRGILSKQYSAEEDGDISNCRFRAFMSGEDNLEEHSLLIGFECSLDYIVNLSLSILISASTEEEKANTLSFLCSNEVEYFVLEETGFIAFDAVNRQGDEIILSKEHFNSFKEPLAGRDCCQLAIRSRRPAPIHIDGLKVKLSDTGLLPEMVVCSGVTQNVGHFKPFGLPMEIYASCEIEQAGLLARTGANAAVSFSLSFEVFEQLLPEYETETEYKVVLKQAPTIPKPIVQEIHADSVLIEYLSKTGWKRLSNEEHLTHIFNGSENGELTIPFTVPNDIIDYSYAGGQPRLRFRLMRADKLYQIPSRQYCPVIENLRFSYNYNESPLTPDCVVTLNNIERQDVSELLSNRRSIVPFYTREQDNTSIYIGFDENPWGLPTSLYLSIDNSADLPVDYLLEYMTKTEFVPLKVMDGTKGMLSSGVMLMMIGKDIARCELFGRELYWIRIKSRRHEQLSDRLPLITGIYTNMAKAENVRTQTELFFLTGETDNSIHLSSGGLISLNVYINEQGGDAENWVRWNRAQHVNQMGRVYDADLPYGIISFPKNVFSVYPVNTNGPSIKVEYQSYHGQAANVPSGSINTTADSIKFLSSVDNPVPAYGGYDGFNEETSAQIISNMLRTRLRAVTREDYFDIIAQVTYGVQRIKCMNGVDLLGNQREDALTIAVLIDEYEKGGHIFSSLKEDIRKRLISCSGLVPAGKTLILTQPRFVRMSARIWLICERMEAAYDTQKQCMNEIARFIDPLTGGFEGRGWDIGVLPSPAELVAFLKLALPETMVSRVSLTAEYDDREYAVDENLSRHITSPFAMAVNGEHIVYCQYVED